MHSRLRRRSQVALIAGAAVSYASRVLRRGAGDVIGPRVALRLDPELLRELARNRRIVVVSGTNGKSTTTALVQAALPGDAPRQTGANMPTGWVTSLSRSAGDLALEVDEPFLAEAIEVLKPAVVCLLNLSRDQLDRTSEVRQIADRWRRVLSGSTTQVVANSNDPLIVYAVGAAVNVTWVSVPVVWTRDASSCPLCTRPLESGPHWECECGFRQPVAHWSLDEGVLHGDGLSLPLTLSLPGEYNRANGAMAVVSAGLVGVNPLVAAGRMSTVTEVLGRFGTVKWKGRNFSVLLAKNPAGVAALCELRSTFSQQVIVSINDNIADGRDPSWLYDAPFDELVAGRRVLCTGTRAWDIATRLAYCDIDVTVVENLDDVPEMLVGTETVTVVANYTAFGEWHRRGEK